MASRLKLHEELCAILENGNVYYQPPTNLAMRYPCIKYSLDGIDHRRANDGIYKKGARYEITVIDRNPDSDIYDKILEHFQMCSFDRVYIAENLYHFILTLYY